jgi:hypothetical protein
MAIVLAGETEEAPTWLEFAIRLLGTSYPHWGGDDGGWTEGVAYALAYNRLNIPALETVRKATGLDLWRRPFFRGLRHFFFHCASPRAEIAPFGDDAENAGPGTSAAAKYATLMRFHAHRFDDRQASWWAEQLPAERDDAADLLSLYAEEPPAPAAPEEGPVARLFPDVGWVAFHSDLSRPSTDTFVLFKSSPYGSASHSHADQNAFCIMKGGIALAIPSGFYGPLASAPHHARWTCSTRANNCVLVDGEGQPIHEPTAAGRIVAFEDHRSWAYAAGDAGGAYAGRLRRYHRHLLFLPPGLLLVLDDLEAPTPATYQWLLHAFEQMEISAARGRIISRRGGRALVVHLRCTLPLHFAQTDVFDPPYDAGIPPEFRREARNQWHVTAATATAARRARIAAAMVVAGPGPEPAIHIEERPGWLGAHVGEAGGSTTGWVCWRPGAPPPVPCAAVGGGEILFAGVSSSGAAFAVPSRDA